MVKLAHARAARWVAMAGNLVMVVVGGEDQWLRRPRVGAFR